jgi:hypothetical protein
VNYNIIHFHVCRTCFALIYPFTQPHSRLNFKKFICAMLFSHFSRWVYKSGVIYWYGIPLNLFLYLSTLYLPIYCFLPRRLFNHVTSQIRQCDCVYTLYTSIFEYLWLTQDFIFFYNIYSCYDLCIHINYFSVLRIQS